MIYPSVANPLDGKCPVPVYGASIRPLGNENLPV